MLVLFIKYKPVKNKNYWQKNEKTNGIKQHILKFNSLIIQKIISAKKDVFNGKK